MLAFGRDLGRTLAARIDVATGPVTVVAAKHVYSNAVSAACRMEQTQTIDCEDGGTAVTMWRNDAAQRSVAPLSALRPLRTKAAEPAGSADCCGVVQRRPAQSMQCRLQAAGWTLTSQPPNPLLRCHSLVRVATWFSTPACARGAHLACR